MSGQDAAMAAALVDALPDPAAEIELRRQLAREAYERGRAEGHREGYLAALAAEKRVQHGIYDDLMLERRRWHVCCARCRRGGHRSGCCDCESRTSQTFSRPHPADYQGSRVVA